MEAPREHRASLLIRTNRSLSTTDLARRAGCSVFSRGNVEPNSRELGTIGYGIGLGLALHLLQIPITLGTALILEATYEGFAGYGSLMLPLYIGISQLLYVVPALVWQGTRGRQLTVRGLCIAA